jgi:hypothetical protein
MRYRVRSVLAAITAAMLLGSGAAPVASAVTLSVTSDTTSIGPLWITDGVLCGNPDSSFHPAVCVAPPAVQYFFQDAGYKVTGTVDTDALTISNLTYSDVAGMSLSLLILGERRFLGEASYATCFSRSSVLPSA